MTEPSIATVLGALHPNDHGGTPTYVIRNRLEMAGEKTTTAMVRRVLNRLEMRGLVHRTRNTLPNSVVWAKGRLGSLSSPAREAGGGR